MKWIDSDGAVNKAYMPGNYIKGPLTSRVADYIRRYYILPEMENVQCEKLD